MFFWLTLKSIFEQSEKNWFLPINLNYLSCCRYSLACKAGALVVDWNVSVKWRKLNKKMLCCQMVLLSNGAVVLKCREFRIYAQPCYGISKMDSRLFLFLSLPNVNFIKVRHKWWWNCGKATEKFSATSVSIDQLHHKLFRLESSICILRTSPMEPQLQQFKQKRSQDTNTHTS